VFSPDDGHIVARNTLRKAINIVRKIVHQFGSIYKKIYPKSVLRHTLTSKKGNQPDLLGYYGDSAEGSVG
jgi:hypothetical protein